MRDPASSADQEPDVLSQEEQIFLDGLLSRVGGPVPAQPAKRRTRRKLRRGVSRTQSLQDAESIEQPTIRLHTLQKGPVRIPVQHRPHTQSPFLVTVQGLVQPIYEEERLPREHSIHDWELPAELSVSPEALLAEALDLHLPDVDPFIFHQQFTPGDADVAFAQTYGFWTRVRRPFIRWEVSRAEKRANVPVRPVQVVRITNEEHLLPSDFDHQWTAQTGAKRVALRHQLALVRHRVSAFLSRTSETIEDGVTELEEREVGVITETEQAWGVPVLVPRLDFIKIFGGLAALLLVASLPAGAVSLSRSFRGTVEQSLGQSRSAVEEVTRLTDATNPLLMAPSALAAASEQFRLAEDGLRQVNGLTTLIVRSLPQTREAYRSSVALLDAGTQATKAGRLVTEGVQEALTMQVRHPIERITTLQTFVDAAIPTLRKASDRMGDVNEDLLPEGEREKVVQARVAIEGGSRALEDISKTLRFARLLMGEAREQTYLLVFQNQAELRPTGGFMGSVAEVMIDRGDIDQVFIPGGGPYDLRSQLKSRVLAPKPLHLVNPRWEFQDANWFPDFAASAEKISWFWSQGGQSTLDGVIAVNASVLEPLLRFTGPIDLPDYGKSFTADNIQLELQKAVELEYDKTENKPKKIIGDLFPVLLERLRNAPPEETLKLISILDESLRKKDVQLWFRDQELQAYTERFGWAGRIKPTKGDALSLIEANIGGQKTDTVIREALDQRVQILPNGQIETTVTLDRTHDGKQGQLFRGANNVEYVRLYVPLGSELLSVEGVQPPTTTAYKLPIAQDLPDPDLARYVNLPRVGPAGVDITQEFGRTAFGAWVQLRPGASSRTVFRYRLPFTVQELSERAMSDYGGATPERGGAYTLYLTSQSGKTDRSLNLHVHYPEAWSVRWSNREDLIQKPGVLTWSGPMAEDQIFALSFALPSSYEQTTVRQEGE
jgi:hypothetical protein